jgi:hypothetical protein
MKTFKRLVIAFFVVAVLFGTGISSAWAAERPTAGQIKAMLDQIGAILNEIKIIVSQMPELNGEVRDERGWIIFKNSENGFQLAYPEGTAVDDRINKGFFLSLKYPKTSDISLPIDISVAFGPQGNAWKCNQYSSDPVLGSFTANGIDFIKSDYSNEYAGSTDWNVAAQYCVVDNGTVYLLTPKLRIADFSGINNDKTIAFLQFDKLIKAMNFQLIDK